MSDVTAKLLAPRKSAKPLPNKTNTRNVVEKKLVRLKSVDLTTANDLPDFTVVDIKEARCDTKSNSSEAFEKVEKSVCDNNDVVDDGDKLEDVIQNVGYCRQQLDGQLAVLTGVISRSSH